MEKEVYSTNSAGTTVHPYTKDLTWTTTLHHIQKVTQMDTDLNLRVKTIKLTQPA